MTQFKCPICRARFRGSVICRRCEADLTPLIRVVNRGVSLYNKALEEARENRWNRALSDINSALAWIRRDEFLKLRDIILKRTEASRPMSST